MCDLYSESDTRPTLVRDAHGLHFGSPATGGNKDRKGRFNPPGRASHGCHVFLAKRVNRPLPRWSSA